MTPQQEIIDSIQILIERAMEDVTRISNGAVTSVGSGYCSMTVDGKSYDNIRYYGSAPEIYTQHRVFIPSGNMSRAFIITGGEGGTTTIVQDTQSMSNSDIEALLANYAE